MKLLLEAVSFFLVFLLLRQTVVRAFPVKEVGIALSHDSQKALKKYRRRYLLLFWIAMPTISFLLVLGFYELFYQLHHGVADGPVLIVERTALLLPSLILGFLAGTLIARWMNSKMQMDGLSFFFEEYQDEWKGFDANRLRGWLVLIALCGAGFMLYSQYQVYAYRKGGEVYWQTSLGENKQRGTHELQSVIPLEPGEFALAFEGGDTLVTEKMSGPVLQFISDIKKPRQ